MSGRVGQLVPRRVRSLVFATSIIAALVVTAAPVQATFPGSNGKIAYVKDPPGDAPASTSTHIWVMNADGSEQKDLSGPSALLDSGPTWSADGSKIAFSSKRGSIYNIWVMNADGSGQTNLTKSSTAFGAPGQPTWSPDGTKIAFSASTQNGSNSEIFTMNPDGSGLLQLTNTQTTTAGGYLESDPQWSPDGTKFVYVEGAACGGDRGVFVMNSDGTNRQKVITSENGARSCITYPTWSPDGSKIAFIDEGIWIINADGTNPVRLSLSVRPFDGLAWSPDGTKLVSGIERSYGCGCRDIFAFALDGSGEQELAVAAENEYLPDWAPGANEIQGTPDNDTITGTPGNDNIYAGDGDDEIDGGGGNDLIIGGAGDDTLLGGSGDDIIYGDDEETEERRRALQTPVAGDDFIDGGSGLDQLFGGGGLDEIIGGVGNDFASGGEAIDELLGGGGSDELDGGTENDDLKGGDGKDRLAGGPGKDKMNGGPGKDTCLKGNKEKALVSCEITLKRNNQRGPL